MLKRLKIKFVIVIMSVVTVLFAAMFGLVMHLTRQNLERESLQMMRAMAFRPPDTALMHKPDDLPDNIRLPFFTVNITEDGTITASGGDFFDLSDGDMLTALVSAAKQSPDLSGILADYDLRFLKSDLMNVRSIVFADISSEEAMINGLIRNFIIIGLIGYAAFFVISLLLAKWMTKPVEHTWNEQKQFIADASHELKTPLTVIMTNAEMLSEQSYSEQENAQFTENILSTSRRMRGLVESLLELARLDHAKAQIPHKRLSFSRLLSDNILPFEPIFFENDLMLRTEIDNSLAVDGDTDKLRQVITILLDNAMKYSTPGCTVDVTLKRQNAGCLLTVSGQGAPLSKEECKRIFKRFYRADPSRNDGKSYGLGLSIAESIVAEHHGKIWAESENGNNFFHVFLPISTSEARQS